MGLPNKSKIWSFENNYKREKCLVIKKNMDWEFPGGPVVKCASTTGGHKFDPW